MNKNLLEKKFIRFLKEKNVYCEYKKHFKSQGDLRLSWAQYNCNSIFNYTPNYSLHDFCKSIKNGKELVRLSFDWESTKQRYEFWKDIDKLWRITFNDF